VPTPEDELVMSAALLPLLELPVSAVLLTSVEEVAPEAVALVEELASVEPVPPVPLEAPEAPERPAEVRAY